MVEEENDASEQLEGREHKPEKQPILKRRKIVAKNGGVTNRWTSGYDLKQMQFIWSSHYFFSFLCIKTKDSLVCLHSC